MALEAWYPLHKDFNDYSGNENHLTGTATTVPDGKIGNAPTGSVGCSLAVPLNENIKRVFSGGEFSLTFWIRNGSGNDDWADILRYNDEHGILRRFERNNSSNASMSDFWHNIGKNESTYSGSIQATTNAGVPVDTWYHVAIVQSNWGLVSNKIYINGVLLYSNTPADIVMSGITTDLLILNGSGNPDSEINDLRFYSHALNLSEVQDVHACKILHWKFNEPLDTSECPNRHSANEMPLIDNWVTGERGLVSATTSPLGSGEVRSLNWATFFGRWGDLSIPGYEYPFPQTLLPYESYCLSVWLRLDDAMTAPATSSDFKFGIGDDETGSYYEIDVNGNIVTTFTSLSQLRQAIDHTWRRFCQVRTKNFDDRCYIVYGFDDFTTTYEWCHPQLVRSLVPTAYVEPAQSSELNKFYDSSGLGNHGVPNDTAEITFASGDRDAVGVMLRSMTNAGGFRTHIESENNVYLPKQGTMMAFIQGTMANQRYDDNLYPFGFDLFSAEANLGDGTARNGLYYRLDASTGTAVETQFPVDLYDGFWHHYAVSWDSDTLEFNVWIDGQHIEYMTGTNPMHHVGTWRKALMGVRTTTSPYGAHTGKFADFRVYATALDTEYVKRIYYTKASLTRMGLLSLHEIVAHSHRGVTGIGKWLRVKGTSFESGAEDVRVISLDGQELSYNNRGHGIVVLDREFNYWGKAGADTHNGTGTSDYYEYANGDYPNVNFTTAAGSKQAACNRLRDYIETVPDGYIVCIATRDSALMHEDWYRQLVSYFGISTPHISLDALRINWLMIGEKKGKLYADVFRDRFDGYVEHQLYLTHNTGVNGRGVMDLNDVSEVGVTDGLVGYWKLDQQTNDYASNLPNLTETNVEFEENALKIVPGTYIQTGLDGFGDMANSTGFTLMALVRRKFDTSDLTTYANGVIFGGFGYNWGIVGYNPNSSYRAHLWRDIDGNGTINSGDAAHTISDMDGYGDHADQLWDFVCMRWDPASRTMTLDVNETSNSTTLSGTERVEFIGDRLDFGSDSNIQAWSTRVLIKEARCYERPLEDKEVDLMRKYLSLHTGMNISRDYTAYVKEVSEI